jgi:dUTP pyrophosphatase
MQIPVKLLDANARLPVRSKPGDAGADLSALEGGHLLPGQRALVRTGVSLEIPEGYYGSISPRSGLAVKSGVDVMAGVIDSPFRGEVQVCLINLCNGGPEETFSWRPGDRIAQLIIEKCEPAAFVEVAALEDTVRGKNGFGSSGLA